MTTVDNGLIITAVVAILAVSAAIIRIDQTLNALKDSVALMRETFKESTAGLNTNILLLIQQITLEAKRSRDDVVDEIRRGRSE